jgi:hypothetical protein
MNADAITRLFKEAYNISPPLKGKPTNKNLLAISETLLPLLMVIPYDQLLGVHSLTAILTEATKYKANHGNSKFVRPSRLPLYDRNITNNTTTIVRVCTKAAHKSHLNNFASYKAAERGVAKFLRGVIDKIWYNNLKVAKTFYTKVTALEIMAQLDANSGGLHAIDMISLRLSMTHYYIQADDIPQFIVMMEDAQKKAKQAGMPIADVELVMMALAAVLTAQHFLQEVDNWEGLSAINCTWRTWKVAFHLAHLKCQRQLQASGWGGPLGSVHAFLPAPPTTIDQLGTALNNLALAVANNTTVLQQLTASNLALSMLVTMLTTANKKLAEVLAKAKQTSPLVAMLGTPRPVRSTNTPFPGSYCRTHGHQCSQHHTSATCGNKAASHKDNASASNTMGGGDANKGWNTHTRRCGMANVVYCDDSNLCKNNYYYALVTEFVPNPPPYASSSSHRYC